MTPFRDVLVCFDGSPPAQAALQAALQLAGRGARLRGLFVVDSKAIRAHFFEDLAGAAGLAPYLDIESQARHSLERIGTALLGAFRQACRKAGVSCDTLLLEDTVAGGILSAAKRSDLVVMGRKGAHGSAASPIGSNVERVARHCPKPVLVVPGKPRPVKKMLVGYDHSEHARDTLMLAARCAAGFKASLTVLHVAEDEAAGKAALGWARRLLDRQGRKAKFEARKGEAADVLPRIAKSSSYDLIVLGAFGQGYLREFLLGSTTDLVLRDTRTPLLIHR